MVVSGSRVVVGMVASGNLANFQDKMSGFCTEIYLKDYTIDDDDNHEHDDEGQHGHNKANFKASRPGFGMKIDLDNA